MTSSKSSPHLSYIKKFLTQHPHSALLISSPDLLTHIFHPNLPFESHQLYLLATASRTLLLHSPLSKPQAFLSSTTLSQLSLKPATSPFSACLTQNLPRYIRRIFIQPQLPHSLSSVLAASYPLDHQSTIFTQLFLHQLPSHIRSAKTAAKITIQTMLHARSLLQPGITEIELTHHIQTHFLKLGAQGPAFPPIVAFGRHTAVPHHLPTSSPYRKNQTALIDIGARVNSVCSDMTRTFLPPHPESLMHTVARIVHLAYTRATNQLTRTKRPFSYSSLHQTAARVISQANFGSNFIHCLGHGIGVSIHQPPSIYTKSKTLVSSNHIITIEPGIYLPGKFGYRHENTLLTTRTGFVTLTQTKNLDIISP